MARSEGFAEERGGGEMEKRIQFLEEELLELEDEVVDLRSELTSLRSLLSEFHPDLAAFEAERAKRLLEDIRAHGGRSFFPNFRSARRGFWFRLRGVFRGS